MIKVTKTLRFHAGHRLLLHEGKCANVHGHTYHVDVTLGTDHQLDDVGRVVDFGIVQEKIGAWIDQWFDHGFICQRGDPIAGWLAFHKQKVYVMDDPPTAENIAIAILAICRLTFLPPVKVVSVTVHETPTCAATVEDA
jgi:6-pyruvoyltetrahydropterin/6-carboxytetrahydropterin synthase